MNDLELLVTLWPSFPHFKKFAFDGRLSGIRLNSAMMPGEELAGELEIAKAISAPVPLYFDIKGWQLRVTASEVKDNRLELTINHEISVKTPTVVLFKAAADYGVLQRIEDGRRLIFDGSPEDMPQYMVKSGESLHIRDPSLVVKGPMLLDYEIDKIQKARKAGFDKFFLSYVWGQRDIEEFREHVGDSQIIAKIEDKKGLAYVANEFKKQDNLSLMAARGDLYVEVDRPHHMLDALKLIIKADPDAYVGSRILLSTIHSPVPECSDLTDMAYLYDLGYKKMMLCDELCLKDELLSRAVNVMQSFKNSYCNNHSGR